MRAFSFAQALAAGHEPRQYRDYVLEGEAKAVLDFKMWGSSDCLRCFFTELETGNKFSLAAYARNSGEKNGRYTPRDHWIDFSWTGLEGTVFHLVTVRGKRGGIVWENAEALTGPLCGA